MNNLKSGETLCDLQLQGLRIIQNEDGYKFTMDAVLLSDFAKGDSNDRALDLCSGSGIIPLLLYGKKKASEIVAVELQEKPYDMMRRSIEFNNLTNQIVAYNIDAKDLPKELGLFDYITINPPYFKKGSVRTSDNTEKFLSKTEHTATIEEIINSAVRHLKVKGSIYIIHKANRLDEILEILKNAKAPAKELRLIFSSVKKDADLFLVKGVLGANPGVKVDKPLVIFNEDGQYTSEVKSIYGDSIK